MLIIQFPNGNLAEIAPGETIDRPFVAIPDNHIVSVMLSRIRQTDANGWCTLTDHEFTLDDVVISYYLVVGYSMPYKDKYVQWVEEDNFCIGDNYGSAYGAFATVAETMTAIDQGYE